MTNDEKTPLVFECCRIVRGYTRSLVCDLQRHSFGFLPNELADLLVETKGMTLKQIKASYNYRYDEIIEANLELLAAAEIVFYTANPEWFVALDLNWRDPRPLTHAIIDVEEAVVFEWKDIWSQLSDLGCEHVQLRLFRQFELSELETILVSIGTLRVTSVELLVPFRPDVSDQELINFVYRLPRIATLLVFSAPENKVVYESATGMGHIYHTTEKITGERHCGKILLESFSVNMSTYTESVHYNSCLNGKIAIDARGNLRNCPSMPRSFGHIKTTSLREAVEHPEFKTAWHITKDRIAGCKDCEFRYICTDCRAYLEAPDDPYSKPLKCGYDPYTATWEDWSANPLKKAAIDYYGMADLVRETPPTTSKWP